MKMKISKKTESIFEIEFNSPEVKTLGDIQEIFLIKPESLIKRSLTESLRKGVEGQDRFSSDIWGE
jgi:hypothetical protein